MFTITRTHQHTRWTSLPREAARATAEWIATTLGFLLARNETLTADQFADRIEQHYDTSNPKTAFVLAFLRSLN